MSPIPCHKITGYVILKLPKILVKFEPEKLKIRSFPDYNLICVCALITYKCYRLHLDLLHFYILYYGRLFRFLLAFSVLSKEHLADKHAVESK